MAISLYMRKSNKAVFRLARPKSRQAVVRGDDGRLRKQEITEALDKPGEYICPLQEVRWRKKCQDYQNEKPQSQGLQARVSRWLSCFRMPGFWCKEVIRQDSVAINCTVPVQCTCTCTVAAVSLMLYNLAQAERVILRKGRTIETACLLINNSHSLTGG